LMAMADRSTSPRPRPCVTACRAARSSSRSTCLPVCYPMSGIPGEAAGLRPAERILDASADESSQSASANQLEQRLVSLVQRPVRIAEHLPCSKKDLSRLHGHLVERVLQARRRSVGVDPGQSRADSPYQLGDELAFGVNSRPLLRDRCLLNDGTQL